MQGVRAGKWINWRLFVSSNSQVDEGEVTECTVKEGIITFETENGTFSFYLDTLHKYGRGYEIAGDAPRKAYLMPTKISQTEKLGLAAFAVCTLVLYGMAAWGTIKGVHALSHSDIVQAIATNGPVVIGGESWLIRQ